MTSEADHNPKDISASTLEEAARWISRFADEPAGASDNAQFRRWYESSDEHRKAFDDLRELNLFIVSNSDTDRMLDICSEARADLETSRRRQGRFRAIAASVTLFLVICGGAVALIRPAFPSKGAEEVVARRYATHANEQTTLALSDGSTVTLDVNSEIRVMYTGTERRIVLDSGHAFFSVARNKRSPFVVVAHNRAITAHGTSFDVWDRADELRVVLMEGSVSVATKRRQNVVRMAPSDVLVVRNGTTVLDSVDDPLRFASWREGLLIFKNDRLSDAVAEINRYADRPISLADDELGELRISGAFHLRGVDAFAEATRTYFDLTDISPSPDEIVLARMKRPST